MDRKKRARGAEQEDEGVALSAAVARYLVTELKADLYVELAASLRPYTAGWEHAWRPVRLGNEDEDDDYHEPDDMDQDDDDDDDDDDDGDDDDDEFAYDDESSDDDDDD